MTNADKNMAEKLLWAVKEYSWRRDIKVIKDCLHSGADVNTEDEFGRDMLTQAVLHNHFEVARLFIGYGADVNKKGSDGFTPLMRAAGNNNVRMAQLLLDNGADMNATKDYGLTALMLCVSYGAEKGVRFLLDKGADIDVRDEEGLTALDMARKMNLIEIADVLERERANRLHAASIGKQQKLSGRMFKPVIRGPKP